MGPWEGLGAPRKTKEGRERHIIVFKFIGRFLSVGELFQ
jgi:hypothetical protein